jgi:hypothetical protein
MNYKGRELKNPLLVLWIILLYPVYMFGVCLCVLALLLTMRSYDAKQFWNTNT